MVAAAPSLPAIPAEQIARDVISEFNPRTGRHELIAAPFDPFEDDPSLAASLRLRSADGAVAIDGYPLQNGALVELDFYYNSPSDDPYGGRNFSDAAFVNGDFAPVVKRDSRILECSTRVENVIYDHASYYGAGYSAGIYRPYRHYAGHSSFGFGFGSSYFGPGYGLFVNSRSGFNRNSFSNRGFNSRGLGSRLSGRSGSSIRSRRSNLGSRALDSERHRDRESSNRDGRRSNDEGASERRSDAERRRQAVRGLSDREVGTRANRVQTFGINRNRSEFRSELRRNLRNSGVGSGVERRARNGNGANIGASSVVQPTRPQPARSQTAQPTATRTATRRTQARRTSAQRSVGQGSNTTSTSANRTSANRTQTRRSETRRNSSSASSNRRTNSSRSQQPKRAKTPSRRISASDNKRRLNFFPNSAHGGRSVVTSTSVDCAREDKLTVFIPNERLDAARFDGLTLIALDAQGGEAPIYLPPNYIEGFRLAETGRVSPQGRPAGAQILAPQIVTPSSRGRIEPAPCPSGTSKQPDGTCLQTESFGYPR